MYGRDETLGIVYDYAQFTVTTGQTDYDVDTNVAALFSNVKVGKNISLKFDQAISVKLNSTLMSAIVLEVGDSPFQFPAKFLDIKNLYITNSSGSTVNMTVLMW